MNNFLEFINKDIEAKRLLITSMPIKTKANQKKLNKTIDEYIEKYTEYKNSVKTYLLAKNHSLEVKEKKHDDEKENLVELERVRFLLNKSNTYFEKLRFDELLYQIDNYNVFKFDSLNEIINSFLDKFEFIGVKLDKDDQNYIDVDDYFYELNRSVPFIIWTKDMKGTKYNQEVKKVMGMIDVQPTLGNMFGFHNEFALGHDIFSVEENVVIFPSGNWLTDKLYYNSAKDAYKQIDLKSEITMDYINYYKQYTEKIMGISDSIINYDLIKKIGTNYDNELLEEESGEKSDKKQGKKG